MSNAPGKAVNQSGRFGDLVELVRDKYVPKATDTDIPCVNLEHIVEGAGRVSGWSKASENLSTKTRFKADDILFGKLRPYLRKYAQPRFAGVCTSELLAFRAKADVDPRYAYQISGSLALSDYCVAASFGTKMPRTDWKTVSTFPVRIPGQDEQRRIANLLSEVDELLESSDGRLTKLVSKREGFVQQRLLPIAFAAEPVSLGAIAPLVTSGSRGWGRYYSDEGPIFLRIGNLTREHPNLRLDDVVRVRIPPGGEGARTKLLENDLLISITADLGIVGCVPSGLGEAYINQHIALARVLEPAVLPRWVAHALASPYGARQIARLNDGGAKAGLNLPTIRALQVPKPRPELQLGVTAVLDAMDAEIASELACAEKLRRLKQGLSDDLLSGQGGVPRKPGS